MAKEWTTEERQRIRDNVAKMRETGRPSGEIDKYLYMEMQEFEGSGPIRGEPSSLQRGTLGAVRGAAEAAAQGLASPLAEEAASGVGAALGTRPGMGFFNYDVPIGQRYSENLAAHRKTLKDFRKRAPAAALAIEGIGAVANPAVRALGAWSVGSKAPQAISMGEKIARGAAAGGGLGTVGGFGAGEGGMDKRLESAGTGAVIGTALGGAAPLVEKGISGGLGFIRDRVINNLRGQHGSATVATRKVAEAIKRDFPDMPPAQAMQEAQKRIREIGPEAALADTGENVRGLAGAVTRTPGEGRTILEGRIRARQEGVRDPSTQALGGGQYGRTMAALDDVTQRPSGLGARRALKEAQGKASRPLYERTANDPGNLLPDERFAAAVDDPYIADYISIVRGDKRATIKIDGKRVRLSDLPENSMPVIDAAQKRMSDAAGNAFRGGENHLGGQLSDARRALVAAADEAFPDYKLARDVWRDFKGVQDADDLGRKFMRGDVDILEDAIGRMKPEELAQFQAGAREALRDVAGRTRTTADISAKLVNVPDIERKIRLAFGGKFPDFARKMLGEREMFKTYAETFGGSPTARREAEAAMASKDPNAVLQAGLDMATGKPISAGMGLVRAVAKPDRSSLPEPVRKEIAMLLAGRDTASLTKAAEIIDRYEAARKELMTALLGMVTAGAQEGARP